MNTPKIFSQTNIHTNGMPESGAEFPGGMSAMHKFIRQHLEYPLSALENEVEGTVVVGFVITENGRIESPEIVNSLQSDCNKAALRLLSLMPTWTPAKNLGTTVPVQVTLPIAFKLANVPTEYE